MFNEWVIEIKELLVDKIKFISIIIQSIEMRNLFVEFIFTLILLDVILVALFKIFRKDNIPEENKYLH